jgi:ABC-type glutathione transport system ATPase component
MMLVFLGVYALCMIGVVYGLFDPSLPKKESQTEMGEVTSDEDALVKQERLRVENLGLDGTDILRVSSLVKKYSRPDPTTSKDKKEDMNMSFRDDRPVGDTNPLEEEKEKEKKKKEGTKAVKGISFGVKKGEIFSLLGVNGAGKTSTFKCMVGDESISGGSITLTDKDVNEIY